MPSTRNRLFAFLGCVFAQIFGQIISVRVKTDAIQIGHMKAHKKGKESLPVDLHRIALKHLCLSSLISFVGELSIARKYQTNNFLDLFFLLGVDGEI